MSTDMLPGTFDVELYRGDDYYHEFTFTDDYDPPTPMNLSDYMFKAQVRDRAEFGKIVYANFIIDTTDASEGIIVISLPAAATNFPPGYWDLEVYDGTTKTTWLKGKVTPMGDVTHIQEVTS